jgi:hypothetical protein
MGFKEAGAYGTGGALAGSVAGPWGAAIGGGVGLLAGLLDDTDSDNKKAARRAELAKQMAFERTGDTYAAYRQQAPAMRMAALQNRLGAYAGVQQAMNTLYPGSQRVDINQLLQPLPMPTFRPAPAPPAPPSAQQQAMQLAQQPSSGNFMTGWNMGPLPEVLGRRQGQ